MIFTRFCNAATLTYSNTKLDTYNASKTSYIIKHTLYVRLSVNLNVCRGDFLLDGHVLHVKTRGTHPGVRTLCGFTDNLHDEVSLSLEKEKA